MAIVFQDTFTGSNDTAITARAPDVGTDWTVGTSATSPEITDANRARAGTTGGTVFVVANPASALSSDEYDVTALIKFLTSGGGGGSRVAVHSHAAVGERGYEFEYNAESGGFSLKRSGSNTGVPFPTAAVSDNAEFNLKLSTILNGSDLECRMYVQRLSDNLWLQKDGSWDTTPEDINTGVSVYADPSPLSVGTAGLSFFDYDGNTVGWHADSFEIEAASTAATEFAFSGPVNVTVGAQSEDFILTPDGDVSAATATPNDGGDGGTFTPTSVSWSSSNANRTFKYTAASIGTKTIEVVITSGSPTTVTPSSINVSAAIRDYIVFIGDSNFGLGGIDSVPEVVLRAMDANWDGDNRGVSGEDIAFCVTDLTNWTGDYDATRDFNLVIVMIGTNDIDNGGATSGASVYAELMDYVADLKTAEPGWMVGIVTLPYSAGYATIRDDMNTLIISDAVTDGADFVIDATGDGANGLEGDVDFNDGLHLTNLGRSRLAAYIAAGIANYIASIEPQAAAATPGSLGGGIHQ